MIRISDQLSDFSDSELRFLQENLFCLFDPQPDQKTDRRLIFVFYKNFGEMILCKTNPRRQFLQVDVFMKIFTEILFQQICGFFFGGFLLIPRYMIS